MITASLIVFICLAIPQSDGNLFTSESHGFRIERPDDSWAFQEGLDPKDGTFSLMIRPGTSQGTVQAAVRAAYLSQAMDAGTIRDKNLEQLKGMEGYTLKEARDFEVAGEQAPGFVIQAEAYGQTFLVHQCYLVKNGMQYALSCNAPQGEFADMETAFHGIWNTIEFMPVSEEMKAEQRLIEMAGKCGREFDWAGTWEEAAEKAAKEKKLVVVLVHSLTSFNISDSASTKAFMDPDVVDIMRERFVAFRFEKGMDAPFVEQDSYGMGPSSFGTTILLVTPQGEVVGDTFSTQAASFHDFLLHHLKMHPKLGGHVSTGGRKGTELIEWYLKRGDYQMAAKLLESPSSSEEHRLRASLLRRLRKGEEALKEIRKAGDLHLDEAVILLRLGRYEEALKNVDRFLEKHKESDRVPEAMYWLGALKQKLKGKDSAEAVWKLLVETHPENRWAWKAAGMLKSTDFALGLGERLDWPPDEIMASLQFPPFEKVKLSYSTKAEREALEFLLRSQRADGSWISPTEVGEFTHERAGDFTVAITAICGKSLLPHRDKPGARDAVTRAVRFLLDEREKEKKAEKFEYFMDYTIYNRTYVLWFLTECLDTGLFKRKELKPVMEELVEDIGTRQKPGGGWSYYITTDLRNVDQPTNQSISFVTAAVLVSLLEARDKGIDVPKKITDKGLDCLVRMLNADSTFEYFLFHDFENAPRNTPPPGAAGRGPLCAYALYRGGRGDLDGIVKTLDLFLEHRHTYAKEHGKTLMHAGLHAQGSHYLMFDYAYAALAIARVPEEDKPRYKKPLLEQMLGARSREGSYVDNPLNGWHYGTGMALIAFHALHPLP